MRWLPMVVVVVLSCGLPAQRDEVGTSRQALEELPNDHPWRALARAASEQTRVAAMAHPGQTTDRPRGEEGAVHG